MTQRARPFRLLVGLAPVLWSFAAQAQSAPGGPPAVGVARAEHEQITETDQFIGRIQAVNRVALVARVTGFLEKRQFVEGAEVKKGDLLYRRAAGDHPLQQLPGDPDSGQPGARHLLRHRARCDGVGLCRVAAVRLWL